jgi:hypothetical protein
MTPSELPLTITHDRIHRILRAGACPILEITAVYPCLDSPEAEARKIAVARFNEAYRSIAEHFTAWASGPLFEAVLADFQGAGMGAAYHFDRRLAVCDMMAEPLARADGEVFALAVTRTLRLCGRRGFVPERHLTAVERWNFPELTLRPHKRRTMSI